MSRSVQRPRGRDRERSKWRVRDVGAAVDRLAPPALAYPWDKSGLAIGDPGADVSAVLLALTLTDAALRAAKRARAEMVVTHHPPIWEPLQTLRLDEPRSRPALGLVRAGITCLSAHTNLDLAEGGVNDALAGRLGLHVLPGPLVLAPHAGMRKLVAFVPESHLAAVREAVCSAGAGRIGDYTCCTFSSPGVGTFLPGAAARPYSGRVGTLNEAPERRFETLVPAHRIDDVVDALCSAHPYEEVAYDVVPVDGPNLHVGLGRLGTLPEAMSLSAFAAYVKARLGAGSVRYVGPADHRVRSVGVIGGAGGSELAATPDGVDVVVTGDVKYHDAVDAAQRGLAVVDAGHAATELPVLGVLARHLRRELPGLRVICHSEPDLFVSA